MESSDKLYLFLKENSVSIEGDIEMFKHVLKFPIYNVRYFKKVVHRYGVYLEKFNELLEFFDDDFYLIEIKL